MKKRIIFGLILILTLSIIISCSTNPTAKIQGVFEVDKELLKKSLQSEIEGENALAMELFDVVIENAVIEFFINGDSINGIIFLAGETTLLESQIIERNDSFVIKTNESEAYLIPTEKGLSYRASGAELTIELNKTDKTDLSDDIKNVIENQKAAIKEKEEFEENLGKWREGNYVDEFGDKTGEGYAYCLIRGTSENSISTNIEVYIKAMVQNEKLNFQIYNSSLSMKESFPDKEFGTMKLKFPDGTVESEKVFFYENSFSESGDQAILFDYILKNEGLVKVFIDLSTASNFYSDKYQFAIEKNNLNEILDGL